MESLKKPNVTADALAPRAREATSRGHTLSGQRAYWTSAGVTGLGLFASLTPSPLYSSYSRLWHFSSLTLTLIYAMYAFGVLATLLLAGAVSDHIGRRPALMAALTGLLSSTLLFLVATSSAWLFLARGLQGLATGALLSAGSAALLDFYTGDKPARVAITNGTSAAVGLGLGMLVSASLVQVGWEPLRLPYLGLLALILLALLATYLMPEPVRRRSRFRLTVQRPRVPPALRRPFALTALALLASWSVGALFFSLGPELAGHLFNTTNALASATGVVALGTAAAAAQIATGRLAPWIATSIGSIALVVGLLLVVIAAAATSGTTYLIGSTIGGAGFGAVFLGGLRALGARIPAEHRAAVMSAFYLVAYGSLSVPAILAGIALSYISLQATFESFGTVVAVVALVVAFEAWRTRPRSTTDGGVAASAVRWRALLARR